MKVTLPPEQNEVVPDAVNVAVGPAPVDTTVAAEVEEHPPVLTTKV